MNESPEQRLADYEALHREMFPDRADATHAERLQALRALAAAFNVQRDVLHTIRIVLRGAP